MSFHTINCSVLLTTAGRGALRWICKSALAAALLLLLAPSLASADDEARKPAPRTTVQIGDASIVLIAANDHLYAFVDRVDGNAPVKDAELDVVSADGTSLSISRATDGLFVAPFNRAGRMHDIFRLALRSPDATGAAEAEIVYDDLPAPAGGGATSGLGAKIAIALVSGGIGALTSAIFVLRLRGSRKRSAARTVGTAQAA